MKSVIIPTLILCLSSTAVLAKKPNLKTLAFQNVTATMGTQSANYDQNTHWDAKALAFNASYLMNETLYFMVQHEQVYATGDLGTAAGEYNTRGPFVGAGYRAPVNYTKDFYFQFLIGDLETETFSDKTLTNQSDKNAMALRFGIKNYSSEKLLIDTWIERTDAEGDTAHSLGRSYNLLLGTRVLVGGAVDYNFDAQEFGWGLTIKLGL